MNLTENDIYRLLELEYGCYLKLFGSEDMADYMELVDYHDISLLQQPVENMLFDEKSANSKHNILAIFIIFGVLNVTANSILIFGLYKTNKKMTSGQKLFVYLSCTDLMAGCVVVPLLIYYQLYGFTCLYMSLMMAICAYIVFADSCILLIISILRLSIIRDPLNTENHQKQSLVLALVQVLFSLLMGSVFFGIFYFGDDLMYFQLVTLLSNIAHTGLSLAVLVCVGISLYLLRKYNRTNSGTFTPEQLKNHRKSVSSLLIIGVMMVLFVLIQVPIFFVLHLKLNDEDGLFQTNFNSTKQVVYGVMLVSQMNTITNAIVIIGRTRRIRRYIFKFCR